MPQRKTRIIPGEIYHAFNRSVAKEPIFTNTRECKRALELIDFYRFPTPIRFSFFNRLPEEAKKEIWQKISKENKPIVEIYAFCFIKNHFHFLIKEFKEGGIKSFFSNFQNAYAKYFNTKHQRHGALFQSQFKTVRIEDDSQFVHVGRYIHLNPLTSFIIKDFEELCDYKLCSFRDYVQNQARDFVSKNMLVGIHGTTKKLISFTQNQINYQRRLSYIKHLILE